MKIPGNCLLVEYDSGGNRASNSKIGERAEERGLFWMFFKVNMVPLYSEFVNINCNPHIVLIAVHNYQSSWHYINSHSLNFKLIFFALYLSILNLILTGTAGDSLTWHNSFPFSTKDRNSGDCSAGDCATLYHGAWWYGDSFQSNLNGKYYFKQDTRTFDGVIWGKWKGLATSLQKTEMKIRPCNDC